MTIGSVEYLTENCNTHSNPFWAYANFKGKYGKVVSYGSVNQWKAHNGKCLEFEMFSVK